MTQSAEHLRAGLVQLSVDKRVDIVDFLWDSLDRSKPGDGDEDKLAADLLALSKDDRIELAMFLWDSAVDDGWEPEFDEELVAELDRRLKEVEADPSTGIPGEEVFWELRNKYQTPPRPQRETKFREI